MALVLSVDEAFVTLSGPSVPPGRRRPLAPIALRTIADTYAAARGHANEGTLRDLGKALFGWLNGGEGWLTPLPAAPFGLEIRAALRPGPNALAVLQAPWELLATAKAGFLAADPLLGDAPVRRLGMPQDPAPPDDHRLGIAFMAGAPRDGGPELDFEAEETAIDRATPAGVDLIVEDSGNPDELGRRLSTLAHPPPVLHLSCHGHNAWPFPQGPQPALLLETPEGDRLATTAAGLATALRSYRPRMIFLSACLTAATDERTAHSMAQALIGGGAGGAGLGRLGRRRGGDRLRPGAV